MGASGKIAANNQLFWKKFMILLTNDDGYDAPGLAALATVAKNLDTDVWIVAPASPRSECGHSVTTDRSLRVLEHGEKEFTVNGTPADCVRIALKTLLPRKPNLVVAGINHGANLGIDRFISGTVAGAREAAFHSLPAVAVSQLWDSSSPVDWSVSTRWTLEVLRKTTAPPLESGRVTNLNLPVQTGKTECPPVVECAPSTDPLDVAYKDNGDGEWSYCGNYHQRQVTPGTDVDVCFSGKISLSTV